MAAAARIFNKLTKKDTSNSSSGVHHGSTSQPAVSIAAASGKRTSSPSPAIRRTSSLVTNSSATLATDDTSKLDDIHETRLCLGIKSFYARTALAASAHTIADESTMHFDRVSLRPPTFAIVTNFELLKNLRHENLTRYIDIITGKHGTYRVVVVVAVIEVYMS